MTDKCVYCDNEAKHLVHGEMICEECSAYCNEDKKRYSVDEVQACKWCEETYHEDYIDEDGICPHCRDRYDEEMNAEHPSLTAAERNGM